MEYIRSGLPRLAEIFGPGGGGPPRAVCTGRLRRRAALQRDGRAAGRRCRRARSVRRRAWSRLAAGEGDAASDARGRRCGRSCARPGWRLMRGLEPLSPRRSSKPGRLSWKARSPSTTGFLVLGGALPPRLGRCGLRHGASATERRVGSSVSDDPTPAGTQTCVVSALRFDTNLRRQPRNSGRTSSSLMLGRIRVGEVLRGPRARWCPTARRR